MEPPSVLVCYVSLSFLFLIVYLHLTLPQSSLHLFPSLSLLLLYLAVNFYLALLESLPSVLVCYLSQSFLFLTVYLYLALLQSHFYVRYLLVTHLTDYLYLALPLGCLLLFPYDTLVFLPFP